MAKEGVLPATGPLSNDATSDDVVATYLTKRWQRLCNPWKASVYTLLVTIMGLAALLLMVHSFLSRQLDVKGCEMSYMRPMYSRYNHFDSEHTRFASKYSLYLYNEGGMDNDNFRVKGVPVLFIPGNAGSYKQVRSLGSESAYYYHNIVRQDGRNGKRPLDFFSVDFNEDFTAFHGQTLLDQAEYLNDAITYILSLYHTPGQYVRDSNLPDPTSVIIVGHSMGGVVARTMLTMPNYQSNSINTIVTLAAPHARAPASFDGDIVRTYKTVNDFWRDTYLQTPSANNPLDQMTLISIAGGGLDTIVSSDYASIDSLVPKTHGFTVFTSSMPHVWTGMDHLAITWCDQNRKSVIRALYDVIDATQASQTVPRAERMSHFKRQFLTGLESIAEKTLTRSDRDIMLILEESQIALDAERLHLRKLGQSSQGSKPYLLSIPTQDTSPKQFSLLTNEALAHPGEHSPLKVLFCGLLTTQSEQSTAFSVHLDFSGEDAGIKRLACKSGHADLVTLPASYRDSTYPFKRERAPFSYLQYSHEELDGYQYVAVIDQSGKHSTGWVVAEFSAIADSVITIEKSLPQLLATGISVNLPPEQPLTMTINVPTLQSSLLAYRFRVGKQVCGKGELFTPLVRQYITDVYESKFFVNVQDAEINLHGVSPFLPQPTHADRTVKGLSFQIWADSTCDSNVEIGLFVDVLGSLGKLWMRYRIVFAAFPLLIVATVLREQFRTYDETGMFMSFAEGLNRCMSSSLPMTFLALTILSVTLASSRPRASQLPEANGNNTIPIPQDLDNDLLLGSSDVFFWFLVPLFGLMCIGICVIMNYIALIIEFLFASLISLILSSSISPNEAKRLPATFAVTSIHRRILTTCILLSMVSTIVPYQFAFVVLCIVQLATSVRAFRLANLSSLNTNYNFYNYAHSIFILMLWILPINLPVLVVWIRNLAIRWLTPFSSHHNVLSIMPFVLLVETISIGRMVPRAQGKFGMVTNVGLFTMGAYAAVYGVSFAYVLHYLANAFCAWLVVLCFEPVVRGGGRVDRMARGTKEGEREMKKRP